MKKITLIFLLSTTYIFSNINAVVSILPEQTFVKAIGGDKVDVSLMVQPGNSPHNYEPKPSQMIEIAKEAHEEYFTREGLSAGEMMVLVDKNLQELETYKATGSMDMNISM